MCSWREWKSSAVVDKISDYLTPASVIAEPHVSELRYKGNKNVFSDPFCHWRNKISFLIIRLGLGSFIVSYSYSITGAVRTATKRAGGTVHNHGGSPGKRLGVKKFSGWFVIVLSQQIPIDLHYHRSVCHPWKHHRQTTGHTISSRTTCTSYSFTFFIHLPIVFLTGKNGSRPYNICHSTGLCSLL